MPTTFTRVRRIRAFCPSFAVSLAALLCLLATSARAARFVSAFEGLERVWIGPEYWANPLQDWQVRHDRLECAVSGGNRNVFLLTHHAGPRPDHGFAVSVRLGRLTASGKRPPAPASRAGRGWAGVRFGIRAALPDYRSAALFGKGVEAGVRTDGTPFVASNAGTQPVDMAGPLALRLALTPSGRGSYTAELTVRDARGRRRQVRTDLPADRVAGHLALVSSWSPPRGQGKQGARRSRFDPSARGGDVRFWFANWQVAGPKIVAHPERAFGPILHAQYTLSRGTLKLTAQMPPLGPRDPRRVLLSIQREARWRKIGEAAIDPLARTARFRIESWDAGRDTPYRLAYTDARGSVTHFDGMIRREPVDKETIVVAGFTGNTDYIFPDARTVRNVAIHDPDVLFFSGDQIYESVAGYGIQTTDHASVETATLDYLRKWWLVGWAWRELTRNRPTLFLPDDHDVYQGNVWGAGGRKSTRRPGFDDGGYGMAPAWVNMVQRTQTSHHPDPYDPTPVQRGIGVYYGEMRYGRISFAVIEDRKFKTGPASVLPPKEGRADHIRPQDVDPATWDPKVLDVPGAKLLGERQLAFLDHWAADWTGADLKVVLSQTIFANVANYHGPQQEYLICDLDSNGWPQTGRNKALAAMRRGFAFHYAGDQHLPSIVHHGIDAHGDAGWSFCVPSISAGYPRAWRPKRPWPHHAPGAPDYTGDFRDGLGNLITVRAVGNPEKKIRRDSPETIGHDKASGYAIVRLNKRSRQITMECYRLLTDAANPRPGDQFPGWPRTIDMEDNYGRQPTGYLPALEVRGMEHPVVQVIDQGAGGETVYTLRIRGTHFRPKVFSPGPFTVIVGEPSLGRIKKLAGLRPGAEGTLEVVVP